MAGKTVSQEQLAEAVKAFCAAEGKQSSQSEEKPNKITIFSGSPEPGDPMLWLEDGLFRCSDSEFGLRFAEEYLSGPGKALAPIPKKNIPAVGKSANGPKNGLAVRDVQVQDMTLEDIKDYLCPAASDKDAYMFLQLCKARNLNPFTNEAYLVPYKDKNDNIKCSMIVGKEAFMRKAEQHPQFRGFKAGIIVSKDEELTYREGTFVRKGETLEGGWAEVYRADRDHPIRSEVALSEYDSGMSLWKSKKATMIRKVPLVQSMREAFATDLAGCYDSDEIGIDPAREVSA